MEREATGDILDSAAGLATALAVTPLQRCTFETTFQAVRAQLAAHHLSVNDMDCVRVPHAVLACAGGATRDAEELTVATTILFAGFDLWDDAMDGDLPSCWQPFGTAAASLTAAALIGGVGPMALRRLAVTGETGAAMQDAVSRAFLGMAAGQQLDMWQTRRADVSADSALASNEGKSGAAIGLYAELAALAGGVSVAEAHRYARLGRLLGSAWQIIGELLDLFESEHSRDLSAGKRTYPIAVHLDGLSVVERKQFEAELERARADEEVARSVRAALIRSGAHFAALMEALRLSEQAGALLDAIIPAPGADAMLRTMIANAIRTKPSPCYA